MTRIFLASTIVSILLLTGCLGTIDMSATLACAHAHNGPVKSEEVVINDNGTLKYVFVWVKPGVPDPPWMPPIERVVMDQTGCMYEPHVMGAMVNQNVNFVNSDLTNHNIHPLARLNQEWNESQRPKGSNIVKRLTKQEVMVPVKCNVPPGTYTLEAWHERYGVKDMEITVSPKEEKAVDFDFKPAA